MHHITSMKGQIPMCVELHTASSWQPTFNLSLNPNSHSQHHPLSPVVLNIKIRPGLWVTVIKPGNWTQPDAADGNELPFVVCGEQGNTDIVTSLCHLCEVSPKQLQSQHTPSVTWRVSFKVVDTVDVENVSAHSQLKPVTQRPSVS